MLLPSLSRLTPTAADADADAELASIHGQRRQRARRRFFQAVLEDDDRGVSEGIEAGARLNQVDAAGETALTVAARLGFARVVRILLDAGANTDTRRAPLFATALYWAVMRGWTEIALLLIEKGANVSITTAERDSPLVAASRLGRTDVARALIQQGARLNTVDQFGGTPLLYASEGGRRRIVEALLSARANVDLANEDDGRTPLIAAVEEGHRRIVNMLLEAGASRSAVNKDGETATDIARREGRNEIVALSKSSGKPWTTSASSCENGASLNVLGVPWYSPVNSPSAFLYSFVAQYWLRWQVSVKAASSAPLSPSG